MASSLGASFGVAISATVFTALGGGDRLDRADDPEARAGRAGDDGRGRAARRRSGDGSALIASRRG